MSNPTHVQMAIEMLEHTADGRKLYQTPAEIERHGRNGDGWQLKCIEMAVNGFLSERGQRLFELLHRQVMADDAAYSMDEFVEKFMPDAIPS